MACSRLPPCQGPHSALDPPGAGVERLIPQLLPGRPGGLRRDPVRELRLSERPAARATPQPVIPPAIVEPLRHPAGAAVRAAPAAQLSPERQLDLIRRTWSRFYTAGVAHRAISPVSVP